MSRTSSTRSPSSILGVLLLVLPVVGCSGDDGAPGLVVSQGTIAGTISNGANGNAPLADVKVTVDPEVPGVAIASDASGRYAARLPAGNYTFAYEFDDFTTKTMPVAVLAGVTRSQDVVLQPVAPVMVRISGSPGMARPGSSFTLTATATPWDGSTVTGYQWTQTRSAQATLSGGDTDTVAVTLGDNAAYKQAVVEHLRVQDRFEVLGIEPLTLEEGSSVTFRCTVTTSSGSYHRDIDVHAHVDFAAVTTGLRNVPLALPVLLGGKVQASYDWSLQRPATSAATLRDAASRFPWFVPDVAGTYTVMVTDQGAPGTVTIPIHAGAWQGGIIGRQANGQPQTFCAQACHATRHNDKFVQWAASGHAEIFTNNINTGGHYGPDCFACHAVGYHPDAQNAGFDDTRDFAAFMAAMFPEGQSHPSPDNWDKVLAEWPEQARMANIQCENCHGPNGAGTAHASTDPAVTAARISVSATVCATCHGEPPRHARYQQWQDSGHGNFATAIDQSRGSCAKCHTAQGFLEWFHNGLDPNFSGTTVPADAAQPITCVVCHDPHDVGTVSGNNNNVRLRVEGDTPELLAGFRAFGLGKGAMCIMCHNTRRGDAASVLTTRPDQAPHGGAQGDVLMGENAFFVTTGVRGSHSLIPDSCATCHVALTPPPAELSYNLSGTNHTFAANTSICQECHGVFSAESLQALTDARLHALADEIEAVILKEIRFHTMAERVVRITGEVNGTAATVDIGAASVIGEIHLEESHGRSAMDIVVDGVMYTHVRLNSDTQIRVGGVAQGQLLQNTFSSVEDVLARSLWNYFLVHSDGSHGVHNPRWVTEIMAFTSAQLRANWP